VVRYIVKGFNDLKDILAFGLEDLDAVYVRGFSLSWIL